MNKEPTFTELIELHERAWGTKQYPGRPSLQDLLTAPIVVVWGQAGRFTLSVYWSAEEVNVDVTNLITGYTGKTDHRKLVKIFYKQKAMDFGVQVVRTTAIKPETPNAPEDKPEQFVMPGPSNVSRGATYQPKVVRSNAVDQPKIVEVNPQRAPKYIRIEEAKSQSGIHYGQSTKARNDKLPGRNK